MSGIDEEHEHGLELEWRVEKVSARGAAQGGSTGGQHRGAAQGGSKGGINCEGGWRQQQGAAAE